MYLRFNIESAGNLLNLVKTSFEKKDTGSVNTLLSVPYFQYLMSDIDIRFYNVIDKQNRFVYRLFLGAGYPLGNSKNLPYEKKYFSGGPNSIRAWNTRDLGPGSDTTKSDYSFFPNKNGDIKLEANIEYRFKLIWKIESAIFLDAGNVWEFKKDVNKPGADFAWDRFYKEIALGTGFGFRFDFSFFLLRIDVGIKLHDPALPIGDRWFHDFKGFGLNDLHLKFGIGYPF
jgi:outer membrane protein assembly factor BamA